MYKKKGERNTGRINVGWWIGHSVWHPAICRISSINRRVATQSRDIVRLISTSCSNRSLNFHRSRRILRNENLRKRMVANGRKLVLII